MRLRCRWRLCWGNLGHRARLVHPENLGLTGRRPDILLHHRPLLLWTSWSRCSLTNSYLLGGTYRLRVGPGPGWWWRGILSRLARCHGSPTLPQLLFSHLLTLLLKCGTYASRGRVRSAAVFAADFITLTLHSWVRPATSAAGVVGSSAETRRVAILETSVALQWRWRGAGTAGHAPKFHASDEHTSFQHFIQRSLAVCEDSHEPGGLSSSCRCNPKESINIEVHSLDEAGGFSQVRSQRHTFYDA